MLKNCVINILLGKNVDKCAGVYTSVWEAMSLVILEC